MPTAHSSSRHGGGLYTPRPDPPQFPPCLWAWTRSPSTSTLAVGLETPQTRPPWDQAPRPGNTHPLDQAPSPEAGTPPCEQNHRRPWKYYRAPTFVAGGKKYPVVCSRYTNKLYAISELPCNIISFHHVICVIESKENNLNELLEPYNELIIQNDNKE